MHGECTDSVCLDSFLSLLTFCIYTVPLYCVQGDTLLGYNVHGTKDVKGDSPEEMGDNLAAVNLGTGFVAQRLHAFQSYYGTSTCVQATSGDIKCFGANYWQQLGFGTGDDRGEYDEDMGDNLPFADLGTVFTQSGKILAGGSGRSKHVCAYEENTALSDEVLMKCWGYAGNKALGVETGSYGTPNMGDDLPFAPLGYTVVPVCDVDEMHGVNWHNLVWIH